MQLEIFTDRKGDLVIKKRGWDGPGKQKVNEVRLTPEEVIKLKRKI